MVQALNLGSTEVLSPGLPQFPHLEMGVVTQLHWAAVRTKLGGIWQVSGTRLVACGPSAVGNSIALPTEREQWEWCVSPTCLNPRNCCDF